MSIHEEIRAASDRFYAALGRLVNGDPAPMLELWSHGSEVVSLHPAGGREVG